MLIVTTHGEVLTSIGSTSREEWEKFPSLAEFFATYMAAEGDKPWA